MNKVKIKALTDKGIKAIAKNRKFEEKTRIRINILPDKFIPEVLREWLRNTTSEYGTDYHLITGKIYTSKEHKEQFIERMVKSMWKINKSVLDIDFIIEFEGEKDE